MSGEEEKAPPPEGPIVLSGHSRPVSDVQFSEVVEGDRVFLATSCLDGKAFLSDGFSGDWIGTFEGHKGAVWSCRLDRTTTRAVTASGDFSASLWDAVTGDQLHTWQHKHIARCATFSRDGAQVLTGSQNKTVAVYDVAAPSDQPLLTLAHSSSVTHLALVANPSLVAGAGPAPGVALWDRRTLEPVRTLHTDAAVSSVRLTHDGRFLVATAGKRVVAWDADTLEQHHSVELGMTVTSAGLEPASNRVVVGGPDELNAYVLNFETGEELACNKGHHGPVRAVDVSPTGKHYATASEDGTIRLWEFAA